VLGQANFTYNTANAPDARKLYDPQGVAIDASTTPNGLYVADRSNNRVLEYNTPLISSTANMVLGQGGSFASNTSNSGGLSANSLSSPIGVAVDGSGDLYVADYFNNRVLEYDAPLTNGASANLVFGQGGSFTSEAAMR
jgi:sugar lactone lactonase YvrE